MLQIIPFAFPVFSCLNNSFYLKVAIETKILCEHIAAFVWLFMYLLNNNRQWREAVKGKLNICSNAEFPVTSAISNIAPYRIFDFLIKIGNRRFLSIVYPSQSTQV